MHPLIYPHPTTGEPTLCVHLNPIGLKGFAKNYDVRDGTAEQIYDEV